MSDQELWDIAVGKGARTDKNPTQMGEDLQAVAQIDEYELLGRLCQIIAQVDAELTLSVHHS